MAEKLEYFFSIGTPISQGEYNEEYQQICPDCSTRLCEGTLIYAREDEEETAFCDGCYWLNNHYKDDRWEDDVGEVSEYVKSRGVDATEVFLLVPARPSPANARLNSSGTTTRFSPTAPTTQLHPCQPPHISREVSAPERLLPCEGPAECTMTILWTVLLFILAKSFGYENNTFMVLIVSVLGSSIAIKTFSWGYKKQ
jgi:hypothetical protein